MKTQITKPVHGKASYSLEYKQQALELWRTSGRSAAKVAAELGVRPALLYEWAKKDRRSSPGQAARGARSLEEVEAENRRLREEVAKLLAGGRGHAAKSWVGGGGYGNVARRRSWSG